MQVYTRAHTHAPAPPPLATPSLSLLDYSSAPGSTAARCDMKSDTVNIPPNPSDCELDSDGNVVGTGDLELWPWQPLAIHPSTSISQQVPSTVKSFAIFR